ncbi:tRNA lysidine(34) synthetase TilS [Marinicella rhabdoformis]|uniref:tRNA lysidine(34) synthetase TilS n=1 Tax=Marinicella rhabdoformis TaxID=2580566 RepID=UPI0012AEBA4A|nr:tRNA lysidine(34) synthetase TilS [Marinicella rhabdoformis]
MAHSANNIELFDPQLFSDEQHFLIAYSGGADSTALLHFCAHHPSLKNRVRAIHINHQLQKPSSEWQSHCEKQCRLWQIPIVVECLTLSDDSENTAREGRRAAFEQHIKHSEVLLTGHHLQDQVETVLFRLFRGTGLKGLGGMQSYSKLPSGHTIHRPLLLISKGQINTYLEFNQLTWVEDPSNQKNQYSRNKIRNQLLPVIEQYDEHAVQAIRQSAAYLQKSHELLLQLLPKDNPIPMNNLVTSTFLHHWIQKQGINPPPAKHLDAFMISCLQAEKHKNPSITWARYTLSLWHKQLYLLKRVAQPKNATLDFHQHIKLPCGGQISFSRPLDMRSLQIRYGVTGFRIKLTKHAQHKSIKKLHQEQKTPPWDKVITPFIYHNNELLAVGSWCTQSFEQLLAANNCDFSWQKPNQIL